MLQEISSHAAYTIVNSEPLVDFAPPTLSRIVYVGGLGAREPKKVDEVSWLPIYFFLEICILRNSTRFWIFGLKLF